MSGSSFITPDPGIGKLIGESSINDFYTGGQHGITPQLNRLDNATPSVLPQRKIFVIDVPRFFKYFDGATRFVKTMIETHTKSFTGLEISKTNETQASHELVDGQSVEVATKATIGSISPSSELVDVYGQPFRRFIESWMSIGINPATQMSNLAAILGDDNIEPFDLSTDSMKILSIQYDITGTPDNIISAALFTNMRPKSITAAKFDRVITEGAEVDNLTVEWTAVAQPPTEVTRQLGIKVAKMANLHKVDTNKLSPLVSDEALDAAVKNPSGFTEQLDRLIQEG